MAGDLIDEVLVGAIAVGGGLGFQTDGLADRDGESSEIGETGGFGGIAATFDEVAGGLDGAAAGVAEDDDHFGAGDLAGELHAGEDFGASDVTGDAAGEDVTKSEVEDHFSGDTGVDASEDDGHGMLAVGGGVDLADEVPIESLA